MKYASLFIVISFTILSCSGTGDGPARQEILTTGTWILSGYKFDYQKDGVYEEDAYAKLEGCTKDNIYTFQSDGILIMDEGLNICNTNNPQTATSSWSFSDNQMRIQFEGEDYQIEELGASTLRLQHTVSYNGIFTMNIEKTFTNQ